MVLFLCSVSQTNNRFHLLSSLPTAYLVRREGYVLTRVCPSIPVCLSTPGGGGVPQPGATGGGTPAKSRWGDVPRPGPTGGGYPSQGEGSTPPRVSPYIRPGWGTPARGIPPWVPPSQTLLGGYPVRPGQGSIPPKVPPCQTWLGVPHLGYTPSDLAGGTPPQVPPVRPGWGVPPCQTWLGGSPPCQTWLGGTLPRV